MYPLPRMWWWTPWTHSLTSLTGLCHFLLYSSLCLATTWLLANFLVFDIPRWTLCNSCRTCCCSLAGITTLMPHMTQSFSKVSSVHLFQYSFNVSYTLSGQPCSVYHSTLLNMGSCPVTHLSCADVMGRASICQTVKLWVSGCLLVSVLWSGRCDNVSAFA